MFVGGSMAVIVWEQRRGKEVRDGANQEQQKIVRRISTFHFGWPPPLCPRPPKKRGGQPETTIWSQFGTRFWTKSPLETNKKPKIFAPAALFLYSFPFRNHQNSDFSGRRRRIFCENTLRNHYRSWNFNRRRRFLARNPFRNPQNTKIFRPPKAAELGSQISSFEKEGGSARRGGQPKWNVLMCLSVFSGQQNLVRRSDSEG